MSLILLLFVLSTLAFQAFPVALGANFKKNASNAFMLIATLVLSQTMMLWLATLVGQRFLYLTEEYRNTIPCGDAHCNGILRCAKRRTYL
jgi:hypothetical protein